MSTLTANNIHLERMLCLSRDNPNVMKKVFRLLEEEVRASNNPRLVDAPCYLHPTHTAFKNAEKALSVSVVSLLGNLHGFFKTSSARRADMVEVREELAETLQDEMDEILDQFFRRHVDTRWLEAERCIQRLLDHWTSTVEYFTVYLPNSPLPNNKLALKCKKYKKIAAQLCQEEAVKTKIRAKFLLLLAQTTKTFLTLLQAQQPMIHKLQELAFDMFNRLGNMVVRPEHMPSRASKVKDMDLFDKSILLSSKDCSFVACCSEEVAMLCSDDRQAIRRELKDSAVAMLIYLQNNLPWDQPLYMQLAFLDPQKRTERNTPNYGAAFFNRFTEPEKVKLAVLLGQYQALPVGQVTVYTAVRCTVYSIQCTVQCTVLSELICCNLHTAH